MKWQQLYIERYIYRESVYWLVLFVWTPFVTNLFHGIPQLSIVRLHSLSILFIQSIDKCALFLTQCHTYMRFKDKSEQTELNDCPTETLLFKKSHLNHFKTKTFALLWCHFHKGPYHTFFSYSLTIATSYCLSMSDKSLMSTIINVVVNNSVALASWRLHHH